MSNHPHGKESSPHSQTASRPLAMEAITNTLMATMPLTVLTAMIDVLNGYGYTLHRHPSPGMFADTGCKANPYELVSPEGNFGVKRPDILEGLFEKSFCSTKQVTQFCTPKSFSGYSQARRPCPSSYPVYFLPLSLKTHRHEEEAYCQETFNQSTCLQMHR